MEPHENAYTFSVLRSHVKACFGYSLGIRTSLMALSACSSRAPAHVVEIDFRIDGIHSMPVWCAAADLRSHPDPSHGRILITAANRSSRPQTSPARNFPLRAVANWDTFVVAVAGRRPPGGVPGAEY